MEDKQNVVEKRIKPGIIRRRARKEKPAPPPEEQAAKPKVEAAAEATVEEVKVKAKPAAKKAAKKPAKSEAPVETPEVLATPAGTEAVSEAEVPATPPPVVEAEKTVAKTAPTASQVKGPRELPEGPPVGTIIDLPHLKKDAAPGAEGGDGAVAKGKYGEDTEDDLKSKARKAGKKGKGAKDELNVEGYGRVSNVSQIARLQSRTQADRVFQPTRTGKRRRTKGRREGRKTPLTMPKASKRVVKMGETIVVSELAQQLGIRNSDIIKKLMDMGSMVALNQSVDFDTASIIAQEYDWEVKRTGFEEEKVLATTEDRAEDLKFRAPVVTVMGHVDHGKTSLLDAIRSTQVAEGEAGGITQHIGSYRISLGEGKVVTFLDTPGHEAFTAMRARGASVTDIVILVVAADDGVMPQTIEAINHAKAAQVPIIVAVNKIDKPEANLENVKRQLSEHGLLAEDWGGDILFTGVSAKTKEGIEGLLELLFLQAEVLSLTSNPNKLAKGVIVEAKLDKGRGPVATALVQEGTLRVGDAVVAGNFFGKIRAMITDRGEEVQEALPGWPVEILGLEGVPSASDSFQALEDEKAAREVVGHRKTKARDQKLSSAGKMSLEDLFSQMQSGDVKELPVILKADVQGSLEALQGSLEKIPSDKVKIKTLHTGVGGITESDVNLAQASNGIIIGFNVRPDTKAREMAEQEQVEVKVYKVIYDVVDDVRKAMEGLLEPTLKENYLGRADVLQPFTVSKVGTIAGCKVADGKIVRNANVRLLRDSVIIHEGKLNSLKRFKDDAKEVTKGFECGMGIEGYNDIKAGDVIECYQIEEFQTKLE